jgi:hypothetical protein
MGTSKRVGGKSRVSRHNKLNYPLVFIFDDALLLL